MAMVDRTSVAEVLSGYLSKASPGKRGEGSRGGHIVGHTRSGRAIYGDREGGHLVHAAFTPDDHRDAARHFEGVAYKALQNRDNIRAKAASAKGAKQGQLIDRAEQADRDVEVADHLINTHEEQAKAKQSNRGAPNKPDLRDYHMFTHGFDVAGKTKSKAPIYLMHDANSSSYKNFSPDDHRDAADVHNRLSRQRFDEREKHLAEAGSGNGVRAKYARMRAEDAEKQSDSHAQLAHSHWVAAREIK